MDVCSVFRKIGFEASFMLRELYGKREYLEVVGEGVSGDISRRIDVVVEDYIVEETRATGFKAVVVGEEKGSRVLNSQPELVVLVDPLDGSLNYTLGIPFASLSIAVYRRGASITEPLYGFVKNIFVDDVFEICSGVVYYNGSRVDKPLDNTDGDNVVSIYTEQPRHLELVSRVFRENKKNLKTRTMGSASLEALYAALGVINGFMHLTGKLRNSDVAVAIGVASALNTGIYVSPGLNELKTSEIVKIEKIVIARRDSEIWKIVDKL